MVCNECQSELDPEEPTSKIVGVCEDCMSEEHWLYYYGLVQDCIYNDIDSHLEN
jgi:hypothetical protein